MKVNTCIDEVYVSLYETVSGFVFFDFLNKNQ